MVRDAATLHKPATGKPPARDGAFGPGVSRRPRHAFGQPGDNGELKIFAAGAIEDDAVYVDQGELCAVAQERDGRTLGNFHANAIRQDALHAGSFHPWQFFEGAAAGIQRYADHAAIAVVSKLLEDGFSADDAIASQFNLIGPEQRETSIAQALGETVRLAA